MPAPLQHRQQGRNFHGRLALERVERRQVIDQLFMLRRVGFSSFVLRADQDENDARAALTRYSNAYQGAYDLPLPAYRCGRRVQAMS